MIKFALILATAKLFFRPVTAEELPIRECCPRGSHFDPDSLSCGGESAPELPSCPGTAFHTISVRELPLLPVARDRDRCAAGETIALCGDPGDVCRERRCIRKCKPPGEYYVNDEAGPEAEAIGGFAPVFYDLATLKPDESVKVSRFGVTFGLQCKDGIIRLDVRGVDTNYLGTNGSLYVPGRGRCYEENEYCVEYVRGEGTFAFVCLESRAVQPEVGVWVILQGAGFIASFVSLLTTFFVYLFYRKWKNLHDLALMSYVGCLCIAYFSLATVHLGNEFLDRKLCTALGYSILLSSLAAFFWLNVMSIDIWKAFRSLRAADWRKAPNSRFVSYSIYAWGIPIAITLLCYVLDELPRGSAWLNNVQPRIGRGRCWFSTATYGIHIFFVAPVSLIVACNALLYVTMAWRCWKVKSEINKLQTMRSGGKYSVHREQLLLNGKLFILMGVSWGPEIISNVLPLPVWKITDAMNSLMGVFIFIIFVMKKRVIDGVKRGLRDSLRSFSVKDQQLPYAKKNLTVTNAAKGDHVTTTNI